jgi:polysaccharide export outer membrane protein
MKKNRNVYFMFIALLIVSSCRSPKDLIMFQETMDNASNINATSPPPKHRIKPFDNLYISIMTLDPDVNRQLNPSIMSSPNTSGGTSQMFGEPTSKYINGYVVSSDSIVTLPMLGDINLVGLNLTEAEQRVKIRAEEFLKEPQIQVKLLNYRVNVSGEVRVPGLYYNYEGNISMFDAISLSQGITEYADLKHVVVKRQAGNNFITYKVDLTNNSIYNSDVFYLQPNDLVYIPPSDLKMRNANSDTYGKLLSTISTLLVAAALIFSLK